MSQLLVAFTSDTEDNHPAYVPGWDSLGSNYDMRPATIKWDWTRYWSDLCKIFRKSDIPVTWLIRTDNGPIHGKMLDLFRDEILELKDKGDEIGIHIHTFGWDHRLSKWIQTRIPEQETEIVSRTLDMFKRKVGFSPLSTRMGWFTMSNEIMRVLDANGLLVDSSAIPGTSSLGKFGERDNIYDWSRAPNVPYHPSHDDYQSSGTLRILEIPISTSEAGRSKILPELVNKLSGIKNLAKLLPIARQLRFNPHRSFYISPWWGSSIYSEIIKTYAQKAQENGTAFLVASFHACDILDPRTGDKNNILEYYLSSIIKEISLLKGIDVQFETLSGMAKRFSQN